MLRTKSWVVGLLLVIGSGPLSYAADVLDFVKDERQASTVIADTLWNLAELGYLKKEQQDLTKLLGRARVHH